MDLRKFSDSGSAFLPSVMWDWCARPTPQEIDSALLSFSKMGISRVYIRASKGLFVKYLSDEFFELVRTAARRSARYGIELWICDEKGTSSGVGGGEITSVFDYRLKEAVCAKKSDAPSDGGIIFEDGEKCVFLRDAKAAYSSAERLYADITDPFVTDCFLESTYAKYMRFCARFTGHEICGFCTNVSLPDVLPYSKSTLKALDTGIEGVFESDAKKNIYLSEFNSLVCKNFTDKIHNFLREKSLLLSAGVSGAEFISRQLSYIACDKPYAEFCGSAKDVLKFKMLTSVSAQFEKKCTARIVVKSNESSAALYNRAMAAAALGACEVCISSVPFTMSDRRKYEEQNIALSPYAQGEISKRISRTLALVNESCDIANALLIYPSSDINCKNPEEQKNAVKAFSVIVNALLSSGVAFHIADEYNLLQNAAVFDKKLRIGSCTYDNLIFPDALFFNPETFEIAKKLEENVFCTQGVKRFLPKANTYDDIFALCDKFSQKHDFLEGGCIITRRRSGEDTFIFVTAQADVSIKGMKNLFIADCADGEFYALDGVNTVLESGESAVFVISENLFCDSAVPFAGGLQTHRLENCFDLNLACVEREKNILPLKNVNACFGKKAYRDDSTDNLHDKFYALGEGESVKLKYPFFVKQPSCEVYAYFENAGDAVILLNGKPLPPLTASEKDLRFSGCDITSLLADGKNTLSMEYKKHSCYTRSFSEREPGYLSAFADTSFEPVYLVGDFDCSENEIFPKNTLENGLFAYYGSLTYSAVLPESELHGKVLTVDGGFDVCKISVGRREKMYFSKSPVFELFDIDCGAAVSITVYNTPYNLFRTKDRAAIPFGITHAAVANKYFYEAP